MEKLNKMTGTLNKIKSISQKIIIEALPIMKELNENSDLVIELTELYKEFEGTDSELEPGEALAALETASLDLTKDAENVLKEIDSFSMYLTKGEEFLEEGEHEYPFLYEVWCGDVYDKMGYDGLSALYTDLQNQSQKTTEDGFLELAQELLGLSR